MLPQNELPPIHKSLPGSNTLRIDHSWNAPSMSLEMKSRHPSGYLARVQISKVSLHFKKLKD